MNHKLKKYESILLSSTKQRIFGSLLEKLKRVMCDVVVNMMCFYKDGAGNGDCRIGNWNEFCRFGAFIGGS